MGRKKMNLNELRRLVKTTISETHRKSNKYNRTKSKAKRDQILANIIEETKRAVFLFEDVDDLNQGGGGNAGAQGANAGAQGGQGGQAAASAPKHPFDNFLVQLLGPNLDGEGGFSMGTAKDEIQAEIMKKIPQIQYKSKDGTMKQANPSGEETYQSHVMKGDSDAKIEFNNTPSNPVGKMLASQTAVYLDQSVDGYFTRTQGNDGVTPSFIKDIINGNVTAKDVFYSNDGYIIDGHHRMSSMSGMNPAATVTGTQMNAPIRKCLKILNLILEAIEGGNAFEASGDSTKSIMGKITSGQQVYDVWKEVVSDESRGFKPIPCWRTYETPNNTGGEGDNGQDTSGDVDKTLLKFAEYVGKLGGAPICNVAKKAVQSGNIMVLCDEVAKNITAWCSEGTNGTVEQTFGPRESMPQLAGKDKREDPDNPREFDYVNDITTGLPAGKYDFVANESVDLKRWHKLAGILKD